MLNKLTALVSRIVPAEEVHAHCDGPCGVYDPAQARVHAEAVVSMTKKLLDLDLENGDEQTHNTFARFVLIKEEEAEAAKHDILVLWTDYFKPQHLSDHPDLHDLFWKTAKLCSDCKHNVNMDQANQLLENVRRIHDMFWKTKGRDVPWITAS